ncbi:MAG TPA: CBS domain-containing protein [Acidimicrobiia bacterium]|nr:CBS domain-containing protein [Acidimicrobiia bacterium]
MLSTVWTKVKDVVTRDTVVVPPHTPVRVAAEVMAGHAIGAVVVATDRKVVGILSERDVVMLLAAGGDPDEATVARAMSADVVSVRPDDTLYDAAVDMLDLGIRHVPVLDEKGALLGMVSVRDLLRPLLTASLDH